LKPTNRQLALYLGECRERQIPVLPPDINESQVRFRWNRGKASGLAHGDQETSARARLSRSWRCAAKQGRITSRHALTQDLDLRLVNKRVFGA